MVTVKNSGPSSVMSSRNSTVNCELIAPLPPMPAAKVWLPSGKEKSEVLKSRPSAAVAGPSPSGSSPAGADTSQATVTGAPSAMAGPS